VRGATIEAPTRKRREHEKVGKGARVEIASKIPDCGGCGQNHEFYDSASSRRFPRIA
jgi:hypothetical protein